LLLWLIDAIVAAIVAITIPFLLYVASFPIIVRPSID
jgi:hypothetical protein